MQRLTFWIEDAQAERLAELAELSRMSRGGVLRALVATARVERRDIGVPVAGAIGGEQEHRQLSA